MLSRASRAQSWIALVFAVSTIVSTGSLLAQSSALAVADQYLTSNATHAGLTVADVSSRRISSSHTSSLNGVTHIWRTSKPRPGD